MEVIKHAAVKSVDGWIFIGKNHGDCFHKAHHIKIKLCSKEKSQGFVTSLGRYVDRVEGGEIAFKSGQIDKETNMLYSEDIWCPNERFQGHYDYSEIEGYTRRGVEDEPE
jgi:hypothetical protein